MNDSESKREQTGIRLTFGSPQQRLRGFFVGDQIARNRKSTCRKLANLIACFDVIHESAQRLRNSSRTTKYVGKLDEVGPYDRMFYVYHTGEAKTDDERVTVINAEELAALVVDAGLVDWLVNKVS